MHSKFTLSAVTLCFLLLPCSAHAAETTTASLDLQKKCADQARKDFDDNGYNERPMASFINHYNSILNKCFIVVMDVDPTKGGWMSKSLVDAFEMKAYGDYYEVRKMDSKVFETHVIQCEVSLSSKEKRACHSSDEFDELTKYYME